jgi:hypothetical protein
MPAVPQTNECIRGSGNALGIPVGTISGCVSGLPIRSARHVCAVF